MPRLDFATTSPLCYKWSKLIGGTSNFSLKVRGDPAVVSVHWEALQYATDELKSDKVFMLKAVDINGNCLEYAHDDLRNDEEIVWNAIMQDGTAIEYASPDLQSNRDFVMMAIEHGYDLEGEVVDDDLRNDEEVVSLAVWNEGYALRHASPGLRNSKTIVLMAVRKNVTVLDYASPRLRDGIDVALAVVRRDGLALRYVSPRLQNHKQVGMEAVSKNGKALLYASDGLKNDKQKDKQVVMEALSENGLTLEFASPSLQNDRHAVMKAVWEDQKAIGFASDTLKRDIEIVAICELRELGWRLPNNVDELPFFLGKANDRPHIICHCLIDRNNLIIETSMASSEDRDVVKDGSDESKEVAGTSSTNHQATDNPILGDPSNTRRRSKRTRSSSSGRDDDDKAKEGLQQIQKEDPLVVAERVFVQI